MKKKQKISIKTGDQVKVIAGDQKGLRGEVKSVNYKKLSAILDISKVRSKFVKVGEKNEEKTLALPIHISNLMLWDEDAKMAGRIGFKMLENKKERYFKTSGNLLKSKIIFSSKKNIKETNG